MVTLSTLYNDFKELIKQNFYDKNEVDAKIRTINSSIPIFVSEQLPTPSESYFATLCIGKSSGNAPYEYELYICKAYLE